LAEQSNRVEERDFNWSLEGKQAPYLIGNRCNLCGKFHFPKTPACTRCLSEELDEIHFGRSGKLYSHSIIHVSSMGLKAPYAIGYVDVDEGERLFAMIIDWGQSDLRSGRSMELTITKLREESSCGRVTGFAYRPKKSN
jgi:uncharacterized OB-fold protein